MRRLRRRLGTPRRDDEESAGAGTGAGYGARAITRSGTHVCV